MTKIQQNSLNSLAVALLAVAVIILAIKEPRCKDNTLKDVDPISQKQHLEQTRQDGSQRELRKFWQN